MSKHKSSLLMLTSIPRCYFIILLSIILVLCYLLFTSKFSSSPSMIADISTLPRSTYFSYINISSQIHASETQGILYVPPMDQPAHFASIKSKAVRGNHRHVGQDNPISGEVIVLLHGQFQIRIGDGQTNQYEDHLFDVSKLGILALNFTAEKCHSVKNVGKETNWFASYYIKSKDIRTAPPVDRNGCQQISLD